MNTDDDTIYVGVVKNNGDGEVEPIKPERIKNELSTDLDVYKSAEVRSAEKTFKSSRRSKSSAEINKLVNELNAAKIEQKLDIGELTNRPVDNGEAAAVLIKAELYNEAQAAKSEEEQITAANNRRNLQIPKGQQRLQNN